ncbi:hypothetical protein [Agromyces sp. NBRC 114283]|uniref:hypothetical protein n=1 Tax=Agromyces sp. NBRC 114283 TaxID=2994521 RepID=UPI0025533DB9|nr:hypothetical protein [Agromyces sp. NBRC 114283]
MSTSTTRRRTFAAALVAAVIAAASVFSAVPAMAEPIQNPVWATTTLGDLTVGQDVGTIQLQAPPADYFAVTMGVLPSGLNMDSSGRITGTPTSAGGYFVQITAVDNAGGGLSSYDFNGTVQPAPPPVTWVTTSLPAAVVGTAYSQTLVAQNATWYNVSSGVLPAGLTLTGATISGTPSVSGTFPITVEAWGNGTFDLAYFTIEVTAPVDPWMTKTLPQLEQGIHVDTVIDVENVASLRLVAGALPAGLAFFEDTWLHLVGTPSALGPYDFTLSVDVDGVSYPQQFTGTVKWPMPSFAAQGLPRAKVGQPYSAQLSGSNWSELGLIAGELPAGLLMNSSGEISGVPIAAGASQFMVTLSNPDYAPGLVLKSFIIFIDPAAPIFTDGVDPLGFQVGEPFSHTFTSDQEAEFSIRSGALPAGTSLTSEGVLSGTPTQSGSYSFSIEVSNEFGSTLRVYTGTVLPAKTTPATPVNTTSATEAKAGAQLEVTGTGFTPGELVEVWLHSTPVRLGELTADGVGNVRGTFTLPAKLEPGVHHIVLVDEHGAEYVSGGLTITAAEGGTAPAVPVTSTKPAPAKPSATQLPALGFDRGTAAVLVGTMLLLGAALLLVGRRRTTATKERG